MPKLSRAELRSKYQSYASIYGEIIELPKNNYPSLDTLTAHIQAVLSEYDVSMTRHSDIQAPPLLQPIDPAVLALLPASISASFQIGPHHDAEGLTIHPSADPHNPQPKVSWELQDLKAMRHQESWSLAQMTCDIKLYEIGDMYLVSYNRLSGDRTRFYELSNRLNTSLTGEPPKKIKSTYQLPPIPPGLLSPITTEQRIEGVKSTFRMVKETRLGRYIENMSLIIDAAKKIESMRAEAKPEDQPTINALADQSIQILLELMVLDEHEGYRSTITRMAIQSTYILSHSDYYLEKLKAIPELEPLLEKLAQHQPKDIKDDYLYTTMRQTCEDIHFNLRKKHLLVALFAQKITNTMLPESVSMRHVPGDGDCLYHAVRMHLDGHPSPEDLRAHVADYVYNHRANYEAHMNIPFDNYVAGIRNGAWADHIEIDALMHIYKRPIIIFHENGAPRTEPQNPPAFPGEPIPVLFDDVNHYNAVIIHAESPLSMQEALGSPLEHLFPIKTFALLHMIGGFLSETDLTRFFGDDKRATTLCKRKEAEWLTLFPAESPAAISKDDGKETHQKEVLQP